MVMALSQSVSGTWAAMMVVNMSKLQIHGQVRLPSNCQLVLMFMQMTLKIIKFKQNLNIMSA